MRSSATPPCPDLDPVFDLATELMALTAQTTRMVAVSYALVSSQRQVDLTGLKEHVGLLCAKALDMPPSQTGFLKLELERLSQSLGELDALLQENAA